MTSTPWIALLLLLLAVSGPACAAASTNSDDDATDVSQDPLLSGTLAAKRLPTSDPSNLGLIAVGSGAGLFGKVDDGTAFDRADDAASYVATASGVASGSHVAGYAGGTPVSNVTKVGIRFRAARLRNAEGTITASLYDGDTLIGTGARHELAGDWTNYGDTFAVTVADSNRLRTMVVLENRAGVDSVAYTQIWLALHTGSADGNDGGAPPTPPPAPPSNLHVSSTTETTVALAWDAQTAGAVAVDHYDVYRDGHLLQGSATGSQSISFTDTDLWPHSTHTYYLFAVAPGGSASTPTPLITAFTNNDVTPPTAPTNLTAAFDPSAASVSLAWGASTDNVYVDHYDVFRNLVKIGSTRATITTFVDEAVPHNATVKYLVQAVDEFSNSSLSSNQPQIVSDMTPPSRVSDLRISAVTSSSVSLAWTAATDNFSVVAYDIYRNGVMIGRQSWASGTTYFDGAGVTAGARYDYTILARDPTGNVSAVSNVATTTTAAGK